MARGTRLATAWLGTALLLLAGFAAAAAPTTPIRHLVVIYQENVSFDHYFATYPLAANRPGEPPFLARPDTPSIDGLSGPLLSRNPNRAAPHRFAPTEAVTCDQEHGYTEEQQAYDGGLLDQFVEHTGTGSAEHAGATRCRRDDVMGYFDGNTVGALWRYAQRFAMSDRFFETTFGPSTLGALNLVAGQTHGATGSCAHAAPAAKCRVADGRLLLGDELEVLEATIIGDPQPEFDDCSSRDTAAMSGRNVGDLLTQHGVSWGFFQGGFRPSGEAHGRALCETKHRVSSGGERSDYIAHHQPFQYFRSTANPHHLPPGSAAQIGQNGDQANHQYDLADFWAAAAAGHLPAVSFVKAPAYQDGHAGYSDPLVEQRFLVETVNRLQQLPEWPRLAIIITYDDSDGWYDHVMPPIVRGSASEADALNGSGRCGAPASVVGRCGFGPRLPFLLLSPYARVNYVDHRVLDQASVLRFIEDNWQLGRLGGDSSDADAGSLESLFDFRSAPRLAPLLLLPETGMPARGQAAP